MSGQSDSFVVSANYGVQSSRALNSTNSIQGDVIEDEILPTPSSWKAINHQSAHPQIFVNSAPEVIYGNPSKNWTLIPAAAGSQDRNDNFRAAPSYDRVNDIHKPSVADLQQMISKILKGATKVHQVVKVPAVYEIHLQEEEKPSSSSWNNLQTSLNTWNKPISFSQPVKQRKPSHFHSHRNGRHSTKTWNLPSKIQYFEKPPTRYGKYPYPRPFTTTKTWKSPGPQSVNAIPLDTWKFPQVSYSSSVNVPMTLASTAVSFLDYSVRGEHQRPGVDLSLYYAKKKELENEGIVHRRSAKGETRRRVRQERLFPGLPPGINYVIHVREKSS